MDALIQVLEGLDHCGCEGKVPTYGVGALAEEVSTTAVPAHFLAQGSRVQAAVAQRYGIAGTDDDQAMPGWLKAILVIGGGAVLYIGGAAVGLWWTKKRIRAQLGFEGLGDTSPEVMRLQKKLETALENARPMKEIRALQKQIDAALRASSKGLSGTSRRRRRRRGL